MASYCFRGKKVLMRENAFDLFMWLVICFYFRYVHALLSTRDNEVNIKDFGKSKITKSKKKKSFNNSKEIDKPKIRS